MKLFFFFLDFRVFFLVYVFRKENFIVCFYEFMLVFNYFGLGRFFLGVSLLFLLCILEVDGIVDKNRSC